MSSIRGGFYRALEAGRTRHRTITELERMYLYLCILICMCAMLPMTMKPSCTVFQFFFRGEKDFSISDALHFFPHPRSLPWVMWSWSGVGVWIYIFRCVFFINTWHVQTSTCVAVIDAGQSAARQNRHVHSDSVPLCFTQHTFSIPLTFYSKLPVHILSLSLSVIPNFPHI